MPWSRKSPVYPQVVPWRAWSRLCTVLDVPDPSGAVWDELMGLVDPPLLEEPSDEPSGVVVGRLNDDGSYTQRNQQDIMRDQLEQDLSFQRERERMLRFYQAVQSCEAMGLQIVQDGDDISEILGIARPGAWQSPNGVWHVDVDLA